MELNDRLKWWRKIKKLTQIELAKQAGFPVRTLKSYESGECQPGAAALAGLSRAGCDINWLLTGEPSASLEKQNQRQSGVEIGSEGGEDTPLNGRLLGVLKMVESIESKEDRELLTDEFFSRIQNAKQMVELKKTVALLSKQKAS